MRGLRAAPPPGSFLPLEARAELCPCPGERASRAVRCQGGANALLLSPGLVSDPAGAQIPAEGLHHAAVPGGGLLLLLLPVVPERDGGCSFPRLALIPFSWTVCRLSVHLFVSLVELTDKQSWLGPGTQRSLFPPALCPSTQLLFKAAFSNFR